MPFVRGSDATHVRLANPMAEDEAWLRRDLLETLARRAEHNLAQRHRDVRLFEIGSAFQPLAERAAARGDACCRDRDGTSASAALDGAEHRRTWTSGTRRGWRSCIARAVASRRSGRSAEPSRRGERAVGDRDRRRSARCRDASRAGRAGVGVRGVRHRADARATSPPSPWLPPGSRRHAPVSTRGVSFAIQLPAVSVDAIDVLRYRAARAERLPAVACGDARCAQSAASCWNRSRCSANIGAPGLPMGSEASPGD